MPYEALPTMYRHALINIFASESENCPNILLEALASGRPIVSSARPPMPEFGGNAVLYFEPRSPADLADKLASLLDEPQRMTDYGERGLEQSQLYRWETSAARTWEAIAQTVRSKRTGARGGLKEVH
jgi:glycosyltransferase involved in cell wall biosynthesis